MMHKKNNYYNIYSICDFILSSIEKETKKRNFFDSKILIHWRDIFEEFADKIKPDKIIFNGENKNKTGDTIITKTLYLSTQDRQFATEFIFYKQQLLDKLNTYFGNEKSVFIDLKLKVV